MFYQTHLILCLWFVHGCRLYDFRLDWLHNKVSSKCIYRIQETVDPKPNEITRSIISGGKRIIIIIYKKKKTRYQMHLEKEIKYSIWHSLVV